MIHLRVFHNVLLVGYLGRDGYSLNLVGAGYCWWDSFILGISIGLEELYGDFYLLCGFFGYCVAMWVVGCDDVLLCGLGVLYEVCVCFHSGNERGCAVLCGGVDGRIVSVSVMY